MKTSNASASLLALIFCLGGGLSLSGQAWADNASGFVSISRGCNHGVALKSDKTVWTWGGNEVGELGDGGSVTEKRKIPAQVQGLDDVQAISAYGRHTLALTEDGKVWAWGCNESGELGTGSMGGDSNVPVEVKGLDDVIAVAAGRSTSLALKKDGTVWIWGDAHRRSGSVVPVQVEELSHMVAIGSGANSFYALKDNGSAWAWGGGDGTLGDQPFTNGSSAPVEVSLGGDVQMISGGWDHALALRKDGTVWAWGANEEGQLGNGEVSKKFDSRPRRVEGLDDVVAVSAGVACSLAVTSDGTVWQWGAGSEKTPVRVQGLENVLAISTGGDNRLALKADGTLAGWVSSNRPTDIQLTETPSIKPAKKVASN